VRYATFMTEVQRATGLLPEDAERATRAVLETLAERVTRGEADDVAAFLPRELRDLLTSTPEPAEAFDLEEFVRRVAAREGVDEPAALEHARGVFRALGAAVAPGELRDLVAQLPRDYEPLIEAAGLAGRQAMERDELVDGVARLAGLDRESALRAATAVLTTLGVRLSAGEVEDFAPDLPAWAQTALDRGVAEQREATPMTETEFVDRVALLEGVPPAVAREHARAVFQALREVIPGKEFSDLAAQLSKDYAPLLA
jgi:uncharacterized protein (DUF2267 family)